MNVFEVMSEGRIIDLGSRLDADQIEQLYHCMRKTCPQCRGTGIGGVALLDLGIGLGMMPVPCDVCDGEGLAFFTSRS